MRICRVGTEIDVVVNDADSLPIVRGTTGILSSFGVPFRVRTLSTRHAPIRIRRFTSGTTNHNVRIVVTTTNVTTRLPKIVTTDAAIPIVNIPVDTALRNVSTLLTVIRVPPKVPITAINISTTVGTNLLTIRVLTITSKHLHARLIRCGRSLGRGVIGTGTSLTTIGCSCGAG